MSEARLLAMILTDDRNPAPKLQLRQGTVSATAVGPPLSVSLLLGGSTVPIVGVRYLAWYSPTVNDVVWVLTRGNDALVLGKLA